MACLNVNFMGRPIGVLPGRYLYVRLTRASANFPAPRTPAVTAGAHRHWPRLSFNPCAASPTADERSGPSRSGNSTSRTRPVGGRLKLLTKAPPMDSVLRQAAGSRVAQCTHRTVSVVQIRPAIAKTVLWEQPRPLRQNGPFPVFDKTRGIIGALDYLMDMQHESFTDAVIAAATRGMRRPKRSRNLSVGLRLIGEDELTSGSSTRN